MFRKSCIVVTGLFKETQPFSDVDFILTLASYFKAVILYETLLYRRLHDANDSGINWENNYSDGIEIIQSYKKNLSKKITRDAMFGLYINFGEDCLQHKKRKKAINNFFKAWKNKPFSFIPLKKTGKAILHYFKK